MKEHEPILYVLQAKAQEISKNVLNNKTYQKLKLHAYKTSVNKHFFANRSVYYHHFRFSFLLRLSKRSNRRLRSSLSGLDGSRGFMRTSSDDVLDN